MATLSLPSGDYFTPPTSLQLVPNTEIFRSPVSAAKQRVERAGAIWVGEYKTRPLNKEETLIFEAFIGGLKGSLNDFYAYDPSFKTPLGSAGGTPRVKGAGQKGNRLIIDGCTNSTLKWLKAGDRFEVGGEYKKMTSDANTNGSGETTLYFEPPMRTSPDDNALITVATPTCRVCLAANDEGKREPDYAGFSSYTFRVEEVFDTVKYWTDENGDYLTDEDGAQITI